MNDTSNDAPHYTGYGILRRIPLKSCEGGCGQFTDKMICELCLAELRALNGGRPVQTGSTSA